MENNWIKVGVVLLALPEADPQVRFCVNVIYEKVLPGKCGWEMGIGP